MRNVRTRRVLITRLMSPHTQEETHMQLTAIQLATIVEHVTATDDVTIEDTNLDGVVAFTRVLDGEAVSSPTLVDRDGNTTTLGEAGDDQR